MSAACFFCGGDLDGNPMRWPAYLLRVGLHCGEHDAAMCPWCLMCQGAEQTEAVKILAREKREVRRRRNLDDLLQRRAPVARPVLLDYSLPNCCIAACAILGRVFRWYGYDSEPIPVRVHAYNAKMLEIIAKGQAIPARGDPQRQLWFDLTGAYGIGIMPESADLMRGVPGGGWGGHLVLRVKDRIVDASIAQASRPGAGIEFPDFLTFPADPEFLAGADHALQLARGGLAILSRLEDRDWRSAPDWTHGQRQLEPMNEIIRRVEDAGSASHAAD
jgi:hypothetical protein